MNVGTLGMCLGPTPARGATSHKRECAGFSWQGSHGRVLMARAPSGEGGRLAAKPQMGRGLGTAETNLGQGSHGPGGMQCNVQLRSLIAFFNCLKGGQYRQFFFGPFGTGVTGL